MADQLTDAQLSEAVCRALGIEPSRVDSRLYYPDVLHYVGCGMVIDRLQDWPGLKWEVLATNRGYAVTIRHNAVVSAFADTLPRALALAVREWEASR